MEFQSPYETEYSRKARDEYSTDIDNFECKMCGYFYDTNEVEVPENATIYWEPHCPYCNAKMTSNPINETRIQIGLNMIRNDVIEEENIETWLDKMQTRARHLHSREVHEYADS